MSSFHTFTFILHAMCLFQINSQYTNIWYDDMQGNNNNHWTSFGTVYFAYDTSSCVTGFCTKTKLVDGDIAWIRRLTDISSYSSLRLTYSVGANHLESTDSCRVYSSYTDSSLESRTLIAEFNNPDHDRHDYPGEVTILPDASSADTVWIWLETCCEGMGDDSCYWDDVYLDGVLAPFTNNPSTKRPTTSSPTNMLTNGPILARTTSPSPAPTKKPTTPSPTDPATISCGEQHSGPYNGEMVTFTVNVPYRGDIQFDASNSNFEVSLIEVTTELGSFLGNDTDGDGVITLFDTPAGDYKFSIYGGTQTDLTYDIRTICTSVAPTSAPTDLPTQIPTMIISSTQLQTQNPIVTNHLTDHPSSNPTNPLKTVYAQQKTSTTNAPNEQTDDGLLMGHEWILSGLWIVIGLCFCCALCALSLLIYKYRQDHVRKATMDHKDSDVLCTGAVQKNIERIKYNGNEGENVVKDDDVMQLTQEGVDDVVNNKNETMVNTANISADEFVIRGNDESKTNEVVIRGGAEPTVYL